MAKDSPTTTRLLLTMGIAAGAAIAIVELVGHITGAASIVTAATGGAIVMVTGLGAAFKKKNQTRAR